MANELKIALGMDAVLLVEGSPFKNVKDVTLNLTRSTADVTTRNNNGWRANVGTLREATISFTAVVSTDTTGGDYHDFIDQFLGDATSDFIGVAALDKEDGEGPVADWSVTSANRGEPLEDAVTYDIELSVAKFYGWYNGADPNTGPENSDDQERWNAILGTT